MADARQALGDVGEAARQTYGDVADRARDVYGDVMDDYVGPYKQSLEDAIVSNPVKAVGAALAVGVLLGWLIKRS
jgi:ElaB/YqjD/DUF883 family membrane-anchored ribosome-binding protein